MFPAKGKVKIGEMKVQILRICYYAVQLTISLSTVTFKACIIQSL